MGTTRKASATRLEAEQEFLASLHDHLDDLHDRIADLAYRKAEARGFEGGHEMEDWLEAERELCAAPPLIADNASDDPAGAISPGTVLPGATAYPAEGSAASHAAE